MLCIVFISTRHEDILRHARSTALRHSVITTIAQEASHLRLEIDTIGATYEGDLKDGQLTGTRTQGPGKLPPVLERAAP